MEFPKMKGIDLNEPVSVTMPAHMWIGFISGYSAVDWVNGAAGAIAQLAQEALLDPIYLNEKLAENQQALDEHNANMAHFLGHLPQGFPPTPEGLEEDNT